MKKIYLIVFCVAMTSLSIAQNGLLQNGGFENWTDTHLYDDLDDWTDANDNEFRGTAAVEQSSDAQLGTYSCELKVVEIGSGSNIDTLFGYVLHGVIGQMGPESGIPYTSTFDEVRFQYKCDMPVGDTLYLLTIRFFMGAPIEMLLQPAAFGTLNSWTVGSVLLPTTPQDELFIGFVMGNPFDGPTPTPGSWARIDNVTIHNGGAAQTAVPNPSFENWTAVTSELPDNWYTMNEFVVSGGVTPVVKTTDANSGTYAVELATFSNPMWGGDTVASVLSFGQIDLFGGSGYLPAPYEASPTTLSGYYKFTPGPNGDNSSFLWVEFYEAGSAIGMAQQAFSSNASYQSFTLPISLTGTPDSMVLVAYSGDSLGSVLQLDDVQFSGGDVGVQEFETMNANLYPNPSNGTFMIKAEGIYGFEVIDLTGKVVLFDEQLIGVATINGDGLTAGTYVVRIFNDNALHTEKLIIE